MFKGLTQRSFLFNLLVACLLLLALSILFFASLGFITKHGETIQVPDVSGQQFSVAERTLEAQNFRVIVQDSAYVDSLPPLAVVRQMPYAGNKVKINRTIYLTLNKTTAPLTAMPDLVNYSFRSAEMTLESQRLKVGDTIYKPDFAKNSVLEQLYNGKSIKAGEMIPEGSKITLVIADGIGNVANPVPNLVGLTYQQALDLLSASSLNVGIVLTSGVLSDTLSAFVFKQSPPKMDQMGQPNTIHAGESIDLWISQTNPSDSTNPDSLTPQQN